MIFLEFTFFSLLISRHAIPHTISSCTEQLPCTAPNRKPAKELFADPKPNEDNRVVDYSFRTPLTGCFPADSQSLKYIDCSTAPQCALRASLRAAFQAGARCKITSHLGIPRISTRLLFWSTITAVLVMFSIAAPNCDWLVIPNVSRVVNVCESITDIVLEVEFRVRIVPV